MNHLNELYPMGEGKIAFETAASQVLLEASDEAMTPFGGFVSSLAAFFEKLGLFDSIAGHCTAVRTSPNACAVCDILTSLILAFLCDESRFNHINRLREDPTLCELFGLKKIVVDDAVRRLFRQIGTGGDWIASASRLLWQAAIERFILDWNSTVQTRYYGHQESACLGCNPHKPSRKVITPS